MKDIKRNPKRVIYTSSPDYCNDVNNMIRLGYGKSRTYLNDLRLVWNIISNDTFSLSVLSKTWDKKVLLQKGTQNRMEQNSTRILEGEKFIRGDKGKDSTKQTRYFWVKQSKLEGWKKSGQRWIYPHLETISSLFRLSWLHEGAPFSYGRTHWQNLGFKGGSASY